VRAVPEGDVLPAWAAEAHKKQAASVVFLDAHGGRAVETLRLPAAYCVAYHEQFVGGDAAGEAYQCYLTLSDPTGWTMAPGGPAAAFVAPAARDHGVPAAVNNFLERETDSEKAMRLTAPVILPHWLSPVKV
jgi:hypothetical protein